MSDTTQPPINSAGLKLPRIPWSKLLSMIGWLIPILFLIAMIYLRTQFVTSIELVPFTTLPSRVEKLEEFKTDQKKSQQETTSTVNIIQQDIAGMKSEIRSLKDESRQNTDRILQRLDSMNRRQ